MQQASPVPRRAFHSNLPIFRPLTFFLSSLPRHSPALLWGIDTDNEPRAEHSQELILGALNTNALATPPLQYEASLAKAEEQCESMDIIQTFGRQFDRMNI